MKPTQEEINISNKNDINNDNNSLIDDENIFKIPDIYKLDYRGKNQDEINKMIQDFNEKKSSDDTDYNSKQIQKAEIAGRIKERYAKESNGKPEDEEFDDSDIFDFEKVEFVEVKSKTGSKYIERDKKRIRTGKKIKDDKLYSFNIEELLELEKYLKIKILGQNHIIDQYISNFMLNTYRNENNDKNLGVFFNFGPSGSGKNYIMELIAEKLNFGYYIIDMSQYHFVEINSLLGATDGYSSNDSIMENINNIAEKYDGKLILIFDEVEKGMNTENGNINTFFTTIMNIINNKEVYTKNNSTKVDLSNFIFVFNSNLGYDQYESKIMNNYNKIGFDLGQNKKVKTEKKKVDSKFIEDYFKNKLKINISVFNRLKRGNNFFFFNPLKSSLFKEYFEREFRNLKIELCYNFEITWDKLPNLEKFKDKIKNFDYTEGFRGIRNIIYIEIKIFLMKNYIFKNHFKKGKLVGIRK
ncbi:MAG: AAA family ATPase [Candidatus Gracilibacteria bacterium]|nr:AAA family ATPase [Candidatus Gracilibacteria bacterium]